MGRLDSVSTTRTSSCKLGKEKANESMNLTLGLSASPDPFGIARRSEGIESSVARFEQWMAQPDSPIRAIRHQAAREGEYAEIPATVAPALRDALIARGIPRLYVHQADALERSVAGQN